MQVKLFLSNLQKVKECFKVPTDFMGVERKRISSDIHLIKGGNHDKKINSDKMIKTSRQLEFFIEKADHVIIWNNSKIIFLNAQNQIVWMNGEVLLLWMT